LSERVAAIGFKYRFITALCGVVFHGNNSNKRQVMKKMWSQFAIITACSMLSASAWAQPDQSDQEYKTGHANAQGMASSNENDRAESSRHLSATGRSTERSIRASQLRGASVQDSSGARIGQIQDLIVNPSSGHIDFAVISLSGQGGASSPSGSSYGSSSQNQQFGDQATAGTGTSTATNSGTEMESSSSVSTAGSSGKLVPVPWSLLRPAAQSSEYSSGSRSQPSFTLNVDQSKLNDAPTIERGSWSEVGRSDWRDRVYTYYGVSADSASGSAESPSGSQKGHGAEKLIEDQDK
jgi:sporulation protein YlmC with PRC-barrel domain